MTCIASSQTPFQLDVDATPPGHRFTKRFMPSLIDFKSLSLGDLSSTRFNSGLGPCIVVLYISSFLFFRECSRVVEHLVLRWLAKDQILDGMNNQVLTPIKGSHRGCCLFGRPRTTRFVLHRVYVQRQSTWGFRYDSLIILQPLPSEARTWMWHNMNIRIVESSSSSQGVANCTTGYIRRNW